jgi:ABC-type oligopeptide transport system ATPase subunit
MSTLRIDRVSKTYQTSGFAGSATSALRQVSFDIDQGEVVTLIGESGSGKTTLGKIVLHLVPASSGGVIFEGTDVSTFGRAQLRDYYRHVQGVFQDPFSSYNPIYRADRVFELLRDVYFPHMPQRAWQDKIESALHGVALNPGDVLGRYPHQLSGGQLQRLLVARALLLDVKLLVADEIISMLDASTRVDVLNLLVGLKRAGLAILFITHDLSLGNYISDRTVILRHGAIAEMGPTVQVFGNPQHSYTKMLLAAVPQLHQKWQKPTADTQVSTSNGTADAVGEAADAVREEVPPRGRSGRVRRPARTGRRPVESAMALEPPRLVECEQGHFVAEEEP